KATDSTCGRQRFACSNARSRLRPAARVTTWNLSRNDSTTLRVLRPMLPVEPKIAMRFMDRDMVQARRPQASGGSEALSRFLVQYRVIPTMFCFSRRTFLSGVAATSATTVFPVLSRGANLGHSPFRVAVINDEISQDFERACAVAAEFGMKWIELRGMWNKNIIDLDAKEVAESQRLLKKHDLRVTDIASPLFKVDWPAAPSKFSPERDQFNANYGFDQQDEVLEKSMAMAKAFNTDRVRCFDFWRLDDQKPHRAEINERLR